MRRIFRVAPALILMGAVATYFLTKPQPTTNTLTPDKIFAAYTNIAEDFFIPPPADVSLTVRADFFEGITRKFLSAPSREYCDKLTGGHVISGEHLTTGGCLIAIGYYSLANATTMHNTIAIGRCSGFHLHAESRDILIGDYTDAPRERDGFVNIKNKLCFWRDSGERADCPPPEPECGQ